MLARDFACFPTRGPLQWWCHKWRFEPFKPEMAPPTSTSRLGQETPWLMRARCHRPSHRPPCEQCTVLRALRARIRHLVAFDTVSSDFVRRYCCKAKPALARGWSPGSPMRAVLAPRPVHRRQLRRHPGASSRGGLFASRPAPLPMLDEPSPASWRVRRQARSFWTSSTRCRCRCRLNS